jgi:hypothetical protein
MRLGSQPSGRLRQSNLASIRMSVSGRGLRLGAPVQHALKADISYCRMLGQPYLMKLRLTTGWSVPDG